MTRKRPYLTSCREEVFSETRHSPGPIELAPYAADRGYD
jgi:hypothetical protein